MKIVTCASYLDNKVCGVAAVVVEVTDPRRGYDILRAFKSMKHLGTSWTAEFAAIEFAIDQYGHTGYDIFCADVQAIKIAHSDTKIRRVHLVKYLYPRQRERFMYRYVLALAKEAWKLDGRPHVAV